MWIEIEIGFSKHFNVAAIQPYPAASDSCGGLRAQCYYMLPLKGIWCFLSLKIHLHLNDSK